LDDRDPRFGTPRRPSDATTVAALPHDRLRPSTAAAILAAVTLAIVLALPSAAGAASRTGYYDTFLLSRAADGGLPNGPSTNGVISQDGRIARSVAFQSDASNIVPGDGNGTTDVFLTTRASGYGADATPWEPGNTRIISGGMGGQPANGPSYDPAISGDASSSRGADDTAPNCVAFVSQASNLVPGDTNGKADAFVYWLDSGRLQRVSVSSTGAQSDGDTFDVAVDGTCERVAFTSNASTLAQTSSGGKKTPNFGANKTRKAKPGVKQVYVRALRAERASDKGLVGLTFLASASNKGKPGNADSSDPSWSLRTSQVLTFTSNASNLDKRDRSFTSDVYVKAIRRVVKFFGKRGKGRRKLPTLQTAVRVVSVNRDGVAGNGPSMQGRASDQSCFVVFRTESTDVFSGDSAPSSDIVRADIRGFLRARKILDVDPGGCRKIEGAAAPAGDRIKITKVARGDGPALDPEVSGGGEYVTFTSGSATFPGVTAADRDVNGVDDVFLWTGVRNVVRTISADTENRPLYGNAHNAFPSQRINYILFETDNPLADVELVSRRDPNLLTRVASAPAPAASNQIYMRYLGPKTVSDGS
jgi:hypothetical protein